MNKVYESRASLIIYNFLKHQTLEGEFIIPANICPIIPAVFYKANKKIVFFDISLETFSIDEDLLIEELKKNPHNYSGILWTNGYGSLNNNNKLFQKIKNLNPSFIIIDDRCLSVPKIEDENLLCDLIVYSTGYGKYVDLDYGGFGFVNDKALYNDKELNFNNNHYNELMDKFYLSINTGEKIDYHDSDWLGSARKIKNTESYDEEISNRLELINRHKAKINQIYIDNIKKEVQISDKFNNWRFNIFINNKSLLLDNLFKNNLFASSHYYSSAKIYGRTKCKNTDFIANNIVNLFNDLRFDEKKAKSVCKFVNEHINKYGISNK